jgi:hypothetical protein
MNATHTPLKIREGAYYRTRGGDVVGPMCHGEPGSHFPWITLTRCWTMAGMVFRGEEGHENCMDLISEVYVSDTPPADALKTEAELRQMMRDPRYWRKRDPEWIKRVTDGFRALVGGDTPLAPEVETLRDRFAGRVLTGMMADHTAPNRPPEFFADLAYKYADAMMEARKK